MCPKPASSTAVNATADIPFLLKMEPEVRDITNLPTM
jgi:hypothetical protein